MQRLLSFLIFAAGLAVAGETVELSAVSPRDEKVTGTLHITMLDAETTLRGVLAETQATLTLAVEADPAQKMEGRLVFPLPPGCVVTGAALDIGDIMRPASATFKDTAKKAYDSVVSRMLDPTLIQLLQDGRVSVQVFPFTGGVQRKLRLDFAQAVRPGAMWEFPLRFADPVGVHLRTDAPFLQSNDSHGGFHGGGEWTVPIPAATAVSLLAHPDGQGRFVFQTLLPAAGASESPKHLLLLADASLLQAGRDAAAEWAFLERLFQKMQTGRVTLATFSTALHNQSEYVVKDGKCDEVLAALTALNFDGAPRPGAVDVSGIPADLTLVLSTLASPMGGGHVPHLPAKAPVWVLDSISPAPSATAEFLASDTGGLALDPRVPQEIQFGHRAAMMTENLTALNFNPLPDGGWLVTGELAAGHGALTFGEKTLIVTRGTDTVSGALAGHQQARRNFLRLAAASDGRLREEMNDSPDAAPFLTATTSLIVLERQDDYERHGIPLPPDLAPLASKTDAGKQDREAFTIFDRALRRPAGERGESREWFRRVRSEQKRAALGERRENDGLFRYHRAPVSTREDEDAWLQKLPEWIAFLGKAGRAVVAAERLAELYRREPAGDSPALIRAAREQQQVRVEMMEGLLDLFGTMRGEGSPAPDPFHLTNWLQRGGSEAAADPFSGPGFGTGFSDNDYLSRTSDAPSNQSEPVVVPFQTTVGSTEVPASADIVPAQTGSSFPVTPTTPSRTRRFDPPQIPQTFGGGGGSLFGYGPFAGNGSSFPVTGGDYPLHVRASPDRGFVGLDYYHPGGAISGWTRAVSDVLALTGLEIIPPSTALRRAGRQEEALRTLSRLAIRGQKDHARLRLLAWVLLEWGEPGLAVEVLEQALRIFGSNDITRRDLGLALLAAGRKDEALTQLRRASHQVAMRDAAALDGRMSAALRIVMECASADADADLEIDGPDYERCSFKNPLPAFGGALSFDAAGEAPEDFVLRGPVAADLKVRVRLSGDRPRTIRVTVIREWGHPGEQRQVFLLPAVQPGDTTVTVIEAVK